MRLRSISGIIEEGIRREDFYDFYALLNAYYENKNDPELKQQLNFLTDYIYNDHMLQFGRILGGRLVDPEHPETLRILNQYGIQFDPESYETTGDDKLSVRDWLAVISAVLRFDHKHGFTGDTWMGLGKSFVELGQSRGSLFDKIKAIDKIYNLIHHGGHLADYMDESRWLEDALNTRDSATPAQIFARASSGVRGLIGRGVYAGQSKPPVSDLMKLYTALLRMAKRESDADVHLEGGVIYVTALGEKRAGMPKALHQPDTQQPGRLTVSEEPDRLVIRDLNDPSGLAVVDKPVDKQHELALDLLIAAGGNRRGNSKLTNGNRMGDIKHSYSKAVHNNSF